MSSNSGPTLQGIVRNFTDENLHGNEWHKIQHAQNCDIIQVKCVCCGRLGPKDTRHHLCDERAMTKAKAGPWNEQCTGIRRSSFLVSCPLFSVASVGVVAREVRTGVVVALQSAPHSISAHIRRLRLKARNEVREAQWCVVERGDCECCQRRRTKGWLDMANEGSRGRGTRR